MLYKSPPENFDTSLKAVTCLVECNGRILLLKRLSHKSEGGKWGVPGGKMDTGEDLKTAMIREAREETGINLQPKNLNLYGTFYVRWAKVDFVIYAFQTSLGTLPAVNLKLDEHSEFVWVTPAESLKMDLVMDQDECIREYYK